MISDSIELCIVELTRVYCTFKFPNFDGPFEKFDGPKNP